MNMDKVMELLLRMSILGCLFGAVWAEHLPATVALSALVIDYIRKD